LDEVDSPDKELPYFELYAILWNVPCIKAQYYCIGITVYKNMKPYLPPLGTLKQAIMTETASTTVDYAQWMIYEEDELSFPTVPGSVQKVIGGCNWIFFSTAYGNGQVTCLDKWDGNVKPVVIIFFSRGARLRVDGGGRVIEDIQGGVIQANAVGAGSPRFAANSAVIRVMKKRDPSETSPVDQSSPSKVIFKVDEHEFYFEKELLCDLSPVFKAMLNDSHSTESATQEIKPTEGTPAEIKAFLQAMLPGDQRVPPNPTNVMALTILADKYDVPTLLAECERSLKFAYEIPVIDRLVLADRLQLKNVQIHLAAILSAKDWKEIVEMEEDKFDMLNGDFKGSVCKRFLRSLL